MVEDFDEIGSWPGRGDWHGRAEHTRNGTVQPLGRKNSRARLRPNTS